MASTGFLDLGKVMLEPSPTFMRLKDKPRPWLPLITLIVLTLAVTYWWISTADFAWLREQMAAAQPDIKPEQREMMEKVFTPNTMLWTQVVAVSLGTLLVTAVVAVYYLIAGKAMGSQIGYGKWFGFVAWTSVPRLLVIPLMALQVATSEGRLAFEDMNMVSLNYLLFQLPMSHPWAGLANSIDLTVPWSLALATIGLKAWTGRSMGTCVFVAALPYVLVYGIWAAGLMIF